MRPAAAIELFAGRTLRIGVTGLARAGKTAFLTSVAANLLALGQGRVVLPALATSLGGRRLRVALAPAGASAVPRFDVASHLAALARDPPSWPARTDAASLLALDLTLERRGLGASLPPRRLRLELLDYPGEWLLDLPLLRLSFAAWSQQALRRLEGRAEAAEFLGFQAGLPQGAPADEALAQAGHRLYRAALGRLRAAGLVLLQPGRFLMPAPGPEPGFMEFFPHRGSGGLLGLLARRYDAYVGQVRRDLSDPLFGRVDRLIVLVDLLAALAAGEAAFQDAQGALIAAASSLRWRRRLTETLGGLARLQAPPPVVGRVAFAATKADHVGARQRANLASLLRHVAEPALGGTAAAFLAVAAVRCTEDTVIEVGGRALSGVRGRRLGEARSIEFYPGEVPSTPPDAEFWRHRFLEMPRFEPLRPVEGGRGGVPQIGLDLLLRAVLEDVL